MTNSLTLASLNHTCTILIPPPRPEQASIGTPFGQGSISRYRERSRRSSLDTVAIQLASFSTNASLAAELCSYASSTLTSIGISSLVAGRYFVLPECVANATALSTITLSSVIIGDFSILPSSITTITAQGCIFSPTNSSSFGYAASGELNWSQIWSVLPNVTSLDILGSQFQASLPSLPSKLNTLKINGTGLTGTIPDAFFANSSSQSLLVIQVYHTSLSGTIPPNWVPSTITNLQIIILDFHGNQLTGSIPSSLIQSLTLFTLTLNLSSNLLTSPPQNIAGVTNAALATIDYSNNPFEGSLATLLFSSFAKLTDLSFYADGCGLNGTIPSGLLPLGTTTKLVLSLQNNRLSGTIPSILTQDLPTSTIFSLRLDGNQLEGSIPSSLLPRTLCSSTTTVTLSLSANGLTGSIPEWSACKFALLSLGSNAGLTGILPSFLISGSNTTQFLAPHTALYGTFPQAVSSNLTYFDLSDTNIEFCSSSSSLGNWTGSCAIDFTDACNCSSVYPVCTTNCIEPASPPTDVPITAPIPATSTTPSALTPTPASPTAALCRGTAPSASFVCIEGVWVGSSVTIVTTTIVIPQGTSPVIITGNVTSSTIIFNTLSSSITIEGCANNLTSVSVELSAEEAEQLGKSKLLHNLVTLSSSSENCTNLSQVALTAKLSGASSCKKISTEKVVSAEGNSLGGYFTLDSSGCNQWWIILIAVLIPVVILGLVAVVVARVIWQRHQEAKQSDLLTSLKPSTAQQ